MSVGFYRKYLSQYGGRVEDINCFISALLSLSKFQGRLQVYPHESN